MASPRFQTKTRRTLRRARPQTAAYYCNKPDFVQNWRRNNCGSTKPGATSLNSPCDTPKAGIARWRKSSQRRAQRRAQRRGNLSAVETECSGTPRRLLPSRVPAFAPGSTHAGTARRNSRTEDLGQQSRARVGHDGLRWHRSGRQFGTHLKPFVNQERAADYDEEPISAPTNDLSGIFQGPSLSKVSGPNRTGTKLQTSKIAR